jgi:hypothetical protein
MRRRIISGLAPAPWQLDRFHPVPASPGGGRRARAGVVVAMLAIVVLASQGWPALASSRPAAPARGVSCTASVTTRYPAADATVGIQVRTVPAAHIRATAHFASGNVIRRSRARGNGRQTVWYRIGHATPGYRVTVDVLTYDNHRKASCSTWFSPRRPRRRHYRPAAWCTATASVYNAQYNWNNVYVHSNQPYRDATASADGYSWGYETNASGYAEIYLNGPPPGVTIKVTVGRATCYTSD